MTQKIDSKLAGGISWKKYVNIDEVLAQARKILGVNYYMESVAKNYIQKYRKIIKKKTVGSSPLVNTKTSKRYTCKE